MKKNSTPKGAVLCEVLYGSFTEVELHPHSWRLSRSGFGVGLVYCQPKSYSQINEIIS
jgi:hypothetical protein